MISVKDEAVGGFTAGVIGTVIGFPLDLIKTRMQTQATFQQNGIFRIGAGIVRREGVFALYKGIGPPLLSLSVLNTINFASYSELHKWYGALQDWDRRNLFAGMTVGPISSIVSTVEGIVKTQMQLDNTRKGCGNGAKYSNSLNCVKTIVSEHGITVLYHGHVINTARECTFLGCYFFMYEGLRKTFICNCNIDTKIAVPVSGGIAGASSWFLSFPLDCIRAGIQGQEKLGEMSYKKKGLYVAKKLWNSKGLVGLYAGVTPSIVRAFLVSGSRFSAYESALWALRKMEPGVSD